MNSVRQTNTHMKVPRCSICRSANTAEESLMPPGADRELRIVVCNDCGHARRSEHRDLDTNITIQVDHFDKTVQEPKSHPRWPDRVALIAAEVQRMAGKQGKVLDIGCSTGLWLSALGDGWKKYGVEVSGAAAQIARKFAKADVFCGSIEQYRAEPASFDLITAFALIEHLMEPRALVEQAYIHLKPGGYLVLMTGDRESAVARHMGARWPLYAPMEHVNFFSARSLCSLLVDAGLKIRRREWRYMDYAGSRLSRCIAKAKELLRLVKTPVYDHFYVYAQKRFNA